MSEVISKLILRMLGKGRKPQQSMPQPKVEPADRIVPLAVVPGSKDRLLNREITDLQFIERVMEEADNPEHPLFERVRFLSIAADVLDQFYAVRVAKMRRSVAKRDGYVTPDGLSPNQQLQRVMARANAIVDQQQASFLSLRDELSDHNIQICDANSIMEEDRLWLHYYFQSHCLHVLTPLTIDEEHPLPFIPSGGLCVVLEFTDTYLLLPLPSSLPRFVALPGGEHRFLRIETVISMFWRDLADYDSLEGMGLFQILRDNDLAREERIDDLRTMVESGLRLRDRASVIRLNVNRGMSETAIQYVAEQLGLMSRKEIRMLVNRGEPLTAAEFIAPEDFVGLAHFSDILALGEAFPRLLFPSHKPRHPEVFERFGFDNFAAITAGDILVHWPFETFDTLVNFIEQAAADPDVIAIKQTFYRTDEDSAIVEALINAARQGKTVLAVIELEARDNERSNVTLAKRMESAGVQIVYGIIGLKIHCKATLVVRMEEGDAITYAHLGTGNYHPKNARTYTDLSFFTRDQVIGRDLHLMFSYLTSARAQPTERLILAPHFLRLRILELIDREIDHAQQNRPAHICIKVNALIDPEVIEKLYEASEAGVKVNLIVRRQSRLRPGVSGMSSRITLKSVVGRFLEHSRIYLFANGRPLAADSADVYFGSPDLMERNLDDRVEVLVPVKDADVRTQIVDGIMHAYIRDTRHSWFLGEDGEYQRSENAADFSAQHYFMQEDHEPLGTFPDEMRLKEQDYG